MQDYHIRLTNNTLKWVESRTFTGPLHHYTRANVGKLIVNSNPLSIRSYDLWTMKDLSEFRHSFEQFFKLAKKRNLYTNIKPVEVQYRKELQGKAVLRYFVSSFTSSKLKHRHWREYAQNYSGVCFRFPERDLQLIGKGNLDMLMGADVIYNQTRQAQLHNRLLDHYHANEIRIFKSKDPKNMAMNFAQLNLGLLQSLVVYGTIFKTRPYKWEDEYRLISMVSNHSLIKYCTNTSRDYIELSFHPNAELHLGAKCTTSYTGCPLRIF